MRKSHQCTRICPLCGKTIIYTEWHEDGTDWLGHHRGHPDSGRDGYECECDKISFPKMCHNCKYYQGKGCINKAVLDKYREEISKSMPFNVCELAIEIKHPERSCSFWAIRDSVINKLFKNQ